ILLTIKENPIRQPFLIVEEKSSKKFCALVAVAFSKTKDHNLLVLARLYDMTVELS
ncbi:hypothetical protein ACJX0J_014984, partial [Zea mays]